MEYYSPFTDLTEFGSLTSFDYYAGQYEKYKNNNLTKCFSDLFETVKTQLTIVTLTGEQKPQLHNTLFQLGFSCRAKLNWHEGHQGDSAIYFYYKFDPTKPGEDNIQSLVRKYDCHMSQRFTCGMSLHTYGVDEAWPLDNDRWTKDDEGYEPDFTEITNPDRLFALIRIPHNKLTQAKEYIEEIETFMFEKIGETDKAVYYCNGWKLNEWSERKENKYYGIEIK